jgi:hypothetical protein
MSVTLVVNNTPFEYPEQGEQQPWGEAATGWAAEVTKVLASVNGPADVLETSATIANNVTTPTDIAGFFFDATQVRSFAVRGNVYRTHSSSEKSEEFLLVGLYQGGSGWIFQQEGIGDAGISFSITPAGQVQYTSSNLAGTPYSGLIKFRGVGLLNT